MLIGTLHITASQPESEIQLSACLRVWGCVLTIVNRMMVNADRYGIHLGNMGARVHFDCPVKYSGMAQFPTDGIAAAGQLRRNPAK